MRRMVQYNDGRSAYYPSADPELDSNYACCIERGVLLTPRAQYVIGSFEIGVYHDATNGTYIPVTHSL